MPIASGFGIAGEQVEGGFRVPQLLRSPHAVQALYDLDTILASPMHVSTKHSTTVDAQRPQQDGSGTREALVAGRVCVKAIERPLGIIDALLKCARLRSGWVFIYPSRASKWQRWCGDADGLCCGRTG